MILALLCDGPVPHPRMNYRGEVVLRLMPRGDNTVHLVAMGVEGAAQLRQDIKLDAISCGPYRSVAGLRSIPIRLWQIIRMFVATKRVLRRDVDVIRTISIIPTFVAVLARGRSNAPILANVSDFYSDLYVGGRLPLKRVAVWLIGRLERLCSRADYLIVDTPSQRERWIRRGVDPLRCIVIPHGLPRSWAAPSEGSPLGVRHAMDESPTRILFYIGDISSMDGVDLLIQATHALRARNRNVRLLVIGRGTDVYLSELRELVRRLSIEDSVELIASVPNNELPAIMERVSVCIAPFRLEETSSTSIPNKVLEYLTSAKPIVVPAGSALQDIFGPAFHYFIPGDAASLAETIDGVLQSESEDLVLRKDIQRAMRWPALMEQEWALMMAIHSGQVGDAQLFDYPLRERVLGVATT